MTIFFIKKIQGRKYDSQEIVAGLKHNEKGAPVLDSSFISISDTKNFWAYTVSSHHVGLDMEEENRRFGDKVLRALHPLEQEYLGALSKGSSEWRKEFFAIWTAKESYMKFCGEGLKLGLSRFSVIDETLSFKTFIDCSRYPSARLIRTDAPAGLSASLCVDPDCADTKAEWRQMDYDAPFAVPVLEKAADFLDTHSYSEKELAQKLADAGYPKEDAFRAARELRSRGYIDHGILAERLAGQGMAKGDGRSKILQTLLQKGIEKDIIDPLMENIGESEEDRAMEIAIKTLGGEVLTEKMKGRIGRRLSNKGFSLSTIYSVIDKLAK